MLSINKNKAAFSLTLYISDGSAFCAYYSRQIVQVREEFYVYSCGNPSLKLCESFNLISSSIFNGEKSDLQTTCI